MNKCDEEVFGVFVGDVRKVNYFGKVVLINSVRCLLNLKRSRSVVRCCYMQIGKKFIFAGK